MEPEEDMAELVVVEVVAVEVVVVAVEAAVVDHSEAIVEVHSVVIVVDHSEGTVEVSMASTKDSELCVYCFMMSLFLVIRFPFKQTSPPICWRDYHFRRITTFLCCISSFHRLKQ